MQQPGQPGAANVSLSLVKEHLLRQKHNENYLLTIKKRRKQ